MSVEASAPTSTRDFVSESCRSASATELWIETTSRRAATRLQYAVSTRAIVSATTRRRRASEAFRSADATRIASRAGSIFKFWRSGWRAAIPRPVAYAGDRIVNRPLVVERPELVKSETEPPVGRSRERLVEAVRLSFSGARSPSGAPEKTELMGSVFFLHAKSACETTS